RIGEGFGKARNREVRGSRAFGNRGNDARGYEGEGSEQANVPFTLTFTLSDLGKDPTRPSLMPSIQERALAMADSSASRLSGFSVEFAGGACTMPFTAAKLGAA